MIAQIDKKQPAMVAFAVNPSGQANLLADVFSPQFCAFMGTIGVHMIISVDWNVLKLEAVRYTSHRPLCQAANDC